MTHLLDQNVDVLRSMPPLLSAESADEFASLRKQLEDGIHPEGPIEQIYLDEFAIIIWEIWRLRRYKTIIINNGRLEALQKILEQLLCCPDSDDPDVVRYFHEHGAEDLARSWFETKKAKTRVAKLLRKFQMDEGAIEVEAFRLCAEHLERLDRMLTASEFRRDKALRFIGEYRQSLSKQFQGAADRILDHDEVPRLVAVSRRPD